MYMQPVPAIMSYFQTISIKLSLTKGVGGTPKTQKTPINFDFYNIFSFI